MAPASDRIARHRKQAEQYLENARLSLREGESQKASEFLWGSFSQALKAISARSGKKLLQHGQLRQFARSLAEELKDPTLWDAYGLAEHLHSDFYEVELSRDDVAAYLERIEPAIRKLWELAVRPPTDQK